MALEVSVWDFLLCSVVYFVLLALLQGPVNLAIKASSPQSPLSIAPCPDIATNFLT